MNKSKPLAQTNDTLATRLNVLDTVGNLASIQPRGSGPFAALSVATTYAKQYNNQISSEKAARDVSAVMVGYSVGGLIGPGAGAAVSYGYMVWNWVRDSIDSASWLWTGGINQIYTPR